MYKRIVAALDGSEVAERALPHVEALAAKFGAAVTLVRATESVAQLAATQAAAAGTIAVAPPAMDITEIAAAEQRDAGEYLDGLKRRFGQSGVDVRTQVLQGGAAAAIVESATDVDADLIVMTTHGRGGLTRVALGSIADEVVRHAPCPVLLVRIPEEK